MGREQVVQRVELATDVSVAFVEQGDRMGPAVVLLHAWGESLGSFDRLTPMLPEALHVFALDQRGHGAADKPADGYDLATLGEDVTAFMDAVGLPSAVLVGSSSGGYVAQQTAVMHPDRVTGLVLVGSPKTLRGRALFADEVTRLTDPIDPVRVRTFLESFPLFHDVPDPYVADRVNDMVRMPARVWRSSLTGLTTSPAPIDSGEISALTMLLWGDRDGLLTREDQEDLAARISGSRLLVYEGVGHLVLWEQPERVAADLVSFIQDLTS